MWQKMLQSGNGGESFDISKPDYNTTFTSKSTSTVINCGFRPRYVVACARRNDTTVTNAQLIAHDIEKGTQAVLWATNEIEYPTNAYITNVTDTSFTVTGNYYGGGLQWIIKMFVYK